MTKDNLLFKKEFSKIKSQDWYRQRFDACPHFMFFLGDAHTSSIQKTKYPYGQQLAFAGFSKNRADWYHSNQALELTAQRIMDRLKKEPKLGSSMVKDFSASEKKFYRLCKELQGLKLSELSDRELLKKYNELANAYTQKLNPSPLIDGFALATDSFIAEKFKSFLKTKNLESMFEKYFATLTAPTFLSFLQKEEIELLTISLKTENNTNQREKLISRHQQSYFWIHNNYVNDNILSEKYFYSRLAKFSKDKCAKKISKLKAIPKQNLAGKRSIIRNLSVPKDIVSLITLTDTFNAWQDERKKGTFWATHYFSYLLEEFSKRSKYSMDQLKYTFPPEMSEVLSGKILKKDLDKRYNYCMIIWQGGKYDVTTDLKLIAKLDSIGTGKTQITEHVTGHVAQTGKVVGKVKVVESVQEISKVSKGDIIVAVMTRPDYLPAMKKAAAFVTDEGGITCHAAIVAREMKKPCIIGTKIATKVFKDGDLVEVDANKGNVKIL